MSDAARLGLQPAQRTADTSAGRLLLRCLSYLRPYWRLAAFGALLLLLGTGLALLVPQQVRWAVDGGIRSQDYGVLGRAVLGILGLILCKGVFTLFTGRWTEIASQGVAYDLRNLLYARLAALSFSYHDRSEVGQLLSRAVQDVDRVRFITGRALLRIFEGAVLLVGTFAMLQWMRPGLAVLALCTMPVLAWRAYAFGRFFRPISLAIQQQLAVLTTRLEQNLRGTRVVKAFAQEAEEFRRFERENEAWFSRSALAARLQAVNMPLLDLISNVGIIFIVWYGGSLVIRGGLTLGELVAFSTYLGQLVQPVRRLGTVLPNIAQAIAAGERVFEILDTPSEVQESPDARPLPRVMGQVRFEHVSFAYFGRHRVLEDVSFTAEPGQVVALLGLTGSGKSSIINLIPRFYDATAGRITIDGHDIRHVTLSSLRDQIGIVLQETTLFAATIRQNIAFARPDAAEEEIVAAARAAQAHEFITQLPQGYDTQVGERGVTLSGGQKQRIAIARALLKDSRILILDDATSSVDSETEQLIQQALEQLMQGRTSFVIAQRLSTVRKADQILVMEEGRIVAGGSHAELLRTSPLYAEIYHRQLQTAAEPGRAEP